MWRRLLSVDKVDLDFGTSKLCPDELQLRDALNARRLKLWKEVAKKTATFSWQRSRSFLFSSLNLIDHSSGRMF